MAKQPRNGNKVTSRKRMPSPKTKTLWDLDADFPAPSPAESASPPASNFDSTPFTNLVIRASAGTGKTFQLSNRYLKLLERGIPADRILATTFTRKAAGEILERIIQRLTTAVEDTGERQQLGRFIGNENLSRERCLELLQQLLRNLHRLRVSTLDSLFGQMARTFSLEIGLPPGWKIIDELQERSLRDSAIAAVLRQESTTELLRLAHLLTKGETRRSVAQLVRETVQELHGLFQESDAEAWHTIPKHKPLEDGELEDLLANLQQVPFTERRAKDACAKDCLQALNGDWEGFIGTGLASKVLSGEGTYFGKPLPDEALKLYERLLAHARAVLVNRLAFQTEGSYELLHKYDSARQCLQRESGGVRFDDITRQLDDALRRDVGMSAAETPRLTDSADQLSYRLDGNISHVLLDEFQDTAPRQWRVLRPFVDRATQDEGKSSFFCVGDVKQAIYGWRGGVAQIFDAIEQHVPRITQQQLVQSFRSSTAVIETVNRVFQGIHKHPNLERAEPAVLAWQKQFEAHSTAKGELPGYACLLTSPAAPEGVAPQDAVLDHAAELIRGLVDSAPTCGIGVLVRRNATVAAMIHALRSRGVDASEEGGNPLIDSAAVQLILSLLRIGDHPGDTVARFHVATSPLGSHVDFSEHEDDGAARRLSLRVRAKLLDEGYGHAIQSWSNALWNEVGPRDVSRLQQLVELAFLYQPQATLRTDDFVKHVEQKRVADPSPAAVRVMTVHQSKGLEFDVVVLPELDFALSGQPPNFVVERPDPTAPVSRVCRYANSQTRQLLPANLQRLFDDYLVQEISESLCVLYVALTRAANALYMVIAPSKENERSLPRTFAGLLRAALADGKLATSNSNLFEHGDAHWLRSVLPAEPPGQPVRSLRPRTNEVPSIPLAASGQRVRGLARVAPSGLEGGDFVRLQTIVDLSDGSAAIRGTVLHSWFQTIQWVDEGVPDDSRLLSIAADLLRVTGVKADCQPWLREFRQMLEQPAINRYLRKEAYESAGSRVLVETERPFAVHDQGGLLTGSIDRLVLVQDGNRFVSAEVIDFKTDKLASDNTSAWQSRIEYYQPQINAYRRAVAVLTGLPPAQISARLIFVSSSRMVEL